MFSGATRSACGPAQSAMGPFYCPNDSKVYLDTSFFQDLERRFRACDAGSKSCQFSQAYVIAHEIGHHLQNLLGILPKVQQMQKGMDKVEANQLQVRVELQADCLAGMWAHHSQKDWQFIEPGDVEAAMQTASAIGDDRLQKQTQGYVVPDAFTHGSSAQRTRWFMNGMKSGTLKSCDTFSANVLRHSSRQVGERSQPAPQPRETVVWGIIWIIVIGFVAGIVARILSPGPNKPKGFIVTTLLGIAGAFVATFIGQTVGWDRPDQGAGFIGATLGAVLVLFIWNRLVVHRVIPDPGVSADPSAPPAGRRL